MAIGATRLIPRRGLVPAEGHATVTQVGCALVIDERYGLEVESLDALEDDPLALGDDLEPGVLLVMAKLGDTLVVIVHAPRPDGERKSFSVKKDLYADVSDMPDPVPGTEVTVKMKIVTQEGCKPCDDIVELVKDGIEAGDVQVIPIETPEGQAFVQDHAIDGTPAVFLELEGKLTRCQITGEDEDGSLLLDCDKPE